MTIKAILTEPNKTLRQISIPVKKVGKEEKNLEATLLIEHHNEEAILMSMKIALERSNYSKVKDLSNTFSKVCKKLCNENKEILDTLANIEPKKNES